MKLARDVKEKDRRIAHIQENVVAATAAVVQATDMLLQASIASKINEADMKPVAKKLIDGSAMLGHVNRELSERRRALIKPYIKPEYKDLCSEETPITKLLFGDEFNQQKLKLKKSSSITKSTVVKFNDNRFSQPYRSRSSSFTRGTHAPKYGRRNESTYDARRQPFLYQSSNTNFKRRSAQNQKSWRK